MQVSLNNYYDVKTRDSKWTPSKLISIEKDSKTFKGLINSRNIIIYDNMYRDPPISQAHLEKMNFKNQKLNNVYALSPYYILGQNNEKSCLAYFGYLIFHNDELSEVQARYRSVYDKLKKEYIINPEIIFDRDKLIRNELNSIYTVNELFNELEKYNIVDYDKDEIVKESLKL